MFKFSKRTSSSSNSDFAQSAAHSAANSSRTSGDIALELVRVAFKDTVRAYSIPPAWLDCEARFVQSRHGERVQVQLIVRRWSGLLLAHSLTFQREVAQCLDRYEPHVDHSQHEWLWKFASECETPFPQMPAAGEWSKKLQSAQPRPAAPAPASASVSAVVAARPAQAASATATSAQPDKAFELRDIFSDLTVEQLKTR